MPDAFLLEDFKFMPFLNIYLVSVGRFLHFQFMPSLNIYLVSVLLDSYLLRRFYSILSVTHCNLATLKCGYLIPSKSTRSTIRRTKRSSSDINDMLEGDIEACNLFRVCHYRVARHYDRDSNNRDWRS